MKKANWFLRVWYKIQGKEQYFVEITEDGVYLSVYSVFAKSPKDATQIFYKEYSLGEDEYVYQITKWFKGCSLPQPVYDFFNGYYLYETKTRENYFDF